MSSELNGSVLVTGGAGYIGSHAVLALSDAGREVVVLDNLSTGRRGAVPDGVPFYRGEVTNGGLIKRIVGHHKCGAVMHFAGSIVVPESVSQPLDYYQNNVVASAQLLRACLDSGIDKFVFSPTAAVYDGDGAKAGALSEDASLAPANPYGRGKLMVECMLRDIAAATKLRYAVLDQIVGTGRNVTLNCGYGHGFSVREVLDVVDQVAADTLGAAAMIR
ncbi:MAG: NAD-dependent epimerase/dehydratase family protein, partial [Alphaproteobacteria bacterium]